LPTPILIISFLALKKAKMSILLDWAVALNLKRGNALAVDSVMVGYIFLAISSFGIRHDCTIENGKISEKVLVGRQIEV